MNDKSLVSQEERDYALCWRKQPVLLFPLKNAGEGSDFTLPKVGIVKPTPRQRDPNAWNPLNLLSPFNFPPLDLPPSQAAAATLDSVPDPSATPIIPPPYTLTLGNYRHPTSLFLVSLSILP